MLADIITIGDEILIGQIVDTNSAWMAKELNALGIQVRKISSISDSSEALIQTLDAAKGKCDLILVTGGLGPTSDDLTKPTLARYFKTNLRVDAEVLKHVQAIFKRNGRGAMPQVNALQAEVLENAEILFNLAGTAPGMYIQDDGMHYFIMPGVPSEMRYIMETHVRARIQAMPGRIGIYHQSLLTVGLGESYLAEQIADIEAALPKHIGMAYLPDFGQVRLRLSGQGQDLQVLQEEVSTYIQALKQRLKGFWVSDDGSSLVESLLKQMQVQGLTLSTAESCTGGRVASMLTAVPGCSAVYQGGVVAYHPSLKTQVLGVSTALMDQYGVVSPETAAGMAEGARKQFKSDYAISSTGIVGPDGGSTTQAVGTVCLAVAGPKETITRTFSFGAFRESNIEKASIQAMILLRSLLYKENSEIKHGV